jgi:hypothetical protein
LNDPYKLLAFETRCPKIKSSKSKDENLASIEGADLGFKK